MTLPVEDKFNNPTAVASVFSRLFYAADDQVLFTQILEDEEQAGKCYQANDPTSEDASDLLQTDGGVIELDGAINVVALEPFRTGVLAFAENGVWYIYGSTTAFNATDFSVSKITSFGTRWDKSVVRVGSIVAYLNDTAVMLVQANEFDNIEATPTSDNNIRTLFTEIFTGASHEDVWGAYEQRENRVWWGNSSSNRAIVLDLNANGFFPQQFSSRGVYVGGGSIEEDGFFFGTSSSENTPTGATVSYNLSEASSTEFTDLGTTYEAYIETGPETLGQVANKKTVTNINVQFKKTETIIDDDGDGGYVYDLPSSCVMTVKFDSDTSDVGGRWTKPIQMYRLNRRGWIPTELPAPFDTGASIITVKEKVRGAGQSAKFRFESEAGKDMQLLGYSVDYSMRGRQ